MNGAVASVPDPTFFELTGRCDLRCQHCYAGVGRTDSDQLCPDVVVRCLDELAEAGAFGVVYSGGEPLLYPDLDQVTAAAASAGLSLGITTNGYGWTERHLTQFVGRVTNLQVSLDSSRPEEHDRLRGRKGAFARASEFVSAAAARGIRTTISMVVLKSNFESLQEMCELSARLGAREFRALRLAPVGRGQLLASEMISPEQVRELKAQLRELGAAWRGQLEVAWDAEFEFGSGRYCTAGRTILAIRPDMNAVPCSFLGDDRFVVGSVNEQRLMDIWHYSPSLAAFRDNSGPVDPRCQDCGHYSSCRGGCRAVREAGGWPPAAYCPVCGEETT